MTTIQHPRQIDWIAGELPDVHTVPYNCRVLAWFVLHIEPQDYATVRQFFPEFDPDVHNGKLRRIEVCHPWEDSLNPLRWCDDGCMPVGYQEKATYWSWINRGEPKLATGPWQKTGF